MKQLEVQIMGQSYLLGCPEGGEERLRAAVDKVDSAMCRIRDAGKIKARDRIAVLAALNLAFDLSDAALAQSRAAAASLPATVSAANAADAEGASSAAEAADARLAQVLQRLDQALGQDGRLI